MSANASMSDGQELEYFKRRYATTVSRSLSEADSAETRREHQFFLERLRSRLQQSGLSTNEINELGSARYRASLVQQAETGTSLSHERSAVLVIHGIGEQSPYETLDQFARNLMRFLKYEGGIEDLTVEGKKMDHNDGIEAMVRLSTEQHGPIVGGEPTSANLDLYEYYWAPQTEDKINYAQTISWLIKTTLTPLKMLDFNIDALQHESDEGLTRSAIWWRELRRIITLYLPIILLLVLLGAWLPKVLDIRSVGAKIANEWSHDHPITRSVMTFFFLASLVLYWIVLRQLAAKWLRWMRQQTAMMPNKWPFWTFLVGVGFTLIGITLGQLEHVNLLQYFHPVLNREVLPVLGTAAVARIVQVFLASYVGDIAVYVNSDAKAKNYAARRAILSGATQAITRLLRDTDNNYQQVIVAGHSLGSVIGYDALNELMNRRLATPDTIVGTVPPKAAVSQNDLEKIKGFITFGSPLDKVHYFFRDFIPKEQSIRAQIYSFLQSFRKQASNSDYGIYRFQPYSAASLRHVKWLNAWSKEDPVSGMLHFYRNVERRQFTYLIPIYAHLSYWEDLRFYEFFAKPMLLGQPEPKALKARGAAV